MRGLAFVGALLALAVWASAAHACSCVPADPARMLADADGALVGVVEAKTAGADGGVSYTIRVEKALKGELGERLTLPSPMNSCQVNHTVGQRVAGVFSGAKETWSIGTCNSLDVDALLAASELPAPSGATRFVAAVDGKTVDAVALGADGKPAGYGWRAGKPLALAGCGATSVAAVRSAGGEVEVITRAVPGLIGTGSVSTLALKTVDALQCTPDGRTFWIAGEEGDRTVVTAIERRRGTHQLHSAPAGAAVAFSRSHAYVASRGRVDVVTLSTGRVRTVRHAGTFAQLSADTGRVAGYLRGGRAAVLDLRSGALRTGKSAGALAWLSRDRLLDAAGGVVRNARLRAVRGVSGVKGRVVAVEDGAAYLADGDVLRRLAPGASRATDFARLPGRVVALTPATAQAAAAWHSCEKSAKSP